MSSKLGEILVREGYITEEQLSEALLRQSQEGGLLGSILIRMGVAHREEISRMLTRKYGVPSIDLSQVEIDPELAQLVREEIARQYRVVPVSRARGCIVLAMVDPTNISVIDELRFLTGFGIEPMVASEAAVLQKIDAYYATKLGEKFASDPRVAAFPAKTWSRLRRAAELTDSAKFLCRQDKYEEARSKLEQAVVVYEGALGPEHVEAAKARSRLGCAYLREEHYEAAELVLQEALDVMEAWFGEDHIDMAKTLNNLGVVFDRKGRNSDARSCYERALAIERGALGDERPETAITVLNVAHTYNRVRRFAEAEPLFQLAVELLRKTYDPSHPTLADAKSGLAACRWSQRALTADEVEHWRR